MVEKCSSRKVNLSEQNRNSIIINKGTAQLTQKYYIRTRE